MKIRILSIVTVASLLTVIGFSVALTVPSAEQNDGSAPEVAEEYDYDTKPPVDDSELDSQNLTDAQYKKLFDWLKSDIQKQIEDDNTSAADVKDFKEVLNWLQDDPDRDTVVSIAVLHVEERMRDPSFTDIPEFVYELGLLNANNTIPECIYPANYVSDTDQGLSEDELEVLTLCGDDITDEDEVDVGEVQSFANPAANN